MLIERNQAVIGVIAAVVIALGTAGALLFTRGLFERGHNISVRFADAAGLSADDQVLVAGVRSGRVTSVELDGDAVKVDLIVSADLPTDSRARISIQNLLGRRLVHLIPGGNWDELLESGDVIPVERTSVPVDVPDFGEELEELTRTTDEEALQAVVSALADVTEGQREEVAELLDGLSRVSDVVADRKEELRDVIDHTETFFAAMRDRDDDIVRIIDAFGSTLDRLSAKRGEVERLLQETARSSTVVADLVEEERATIDSTLRQLHETLEIVDRNQVDIAHFFAYSGVALKGFSEVGRSGNQDNPYWANMHATGLGQIGIDALFGCGGTFDEMLDELFGPDPRSCEEQTAEPTPSEREDEADGDSASASALRGLFDLSAHRTAAGEDLR